MYNENKKDKIVCFSGHGSPLNTGPVKVSFLGVPYSRHHCMYSEHPNSESPKSELRRNLNF